MSQSLFPQNVVAVIWDFDKTLTPAYMQQPLFRKFGVDEKKFWKEVNELPQYYKERGITNVSRDTLYLNHILTYVRRGRFKGLNNKLLRELGAEIEFYEGLPEFFESLRESVNQNPSFAQHDISVEHYIVSTGLREMIMGSKIAKYVDGVWACEFVEDIAEPGYLDKRQPELFSKKDDEAREIQDIGYALDNTTKTRAIFEINKGTNRFPDIDVNATIAHEDRRVPFQNMIYLADGPSDVPAFSILNQYHGRTFSVYKPKIMDQFVQANELLKRGRVQCIGEASYVEGSLTTMWITNAVEDICRRIANDRAVILKSKIGVSPQHILSDIPDTAPRHEKKVPESAAAKSRAMPDLASVVRDATGDERIS